MTAMKAEKTTAMQAAAVDLLDSVPAGLLVTEIEGTSHVVMISHPKK